MYFFRFQVGDWVKEIGLPQHHLRVTALDLDMNTGLPIYQIFDTTLRRGHADYEWRWAHEFEANSMLVQRADSSRHVQQILERCQNFYCLKYSIPQRQDCESIQRFIHTGREEDRWSPQVWTGIAAAVTVGIIVAANR
jgi:hypothetical protein